MDEKSALIIRAAAFVECAGALDMRAQKYLQIGRAGKHAMLAVRQEADHLRDRAVELRQAADARS